MMLPSLTVPISLFVMLLFLPPSYTLSINSSLPDLVDIKNPLGINCRGSILCPAYQNPYPPYYIDTLLEIANGSGPPCPPTFFCGPLKHRDIYLPNDHIVCLPLGMSFLGGICAFTQGQNVPKSGVNGSLITRKLWELHDHGCMGCGSVPLGGDNDPNSLGTLTVNYVAGRACKGLCPSKHYEALFQSAANQSGLLVTGVTGDSLLES